MFAKLIQINFYDLKYVQTPIISKENSQKVEILCQFSISQLMQIKVKISGKITRRKILSLIFLSPAASDKN